jgi:EH_Signature domain
LTRAVFKALLANYREDSLRAILRSFVARYEEALPSNDRRFCKQSGILDGDNHVAVLGRSLVQSGDIYSLCLSYGLTTNILATNYGTELKLASVRESLNGADAKAIHRVLTWAFDGISGVPLGDFYEAVLSPFETKLPPPDVQKLLMSTLVTKFGDPRIDVWPGLTGRDGENRKNECIATLKRWLSIEYLDLFIRIIEATAVDHQFRPRKSFWLKYFEKGVISDLTLVLASDANAIARKTRGQSVDSEYMKWASLNLALPDQSVLLMRLGDLLIAEWSHNGAMRFWKADSNAAPEFHLADYNGADLRNGSIKVKVAGGYRDAIVHMPNGQWMTWARNAIEFHTGVRA